MVDCFRIFGDRAFRKVSPESPRRHPINRALFEAWSADIEGLSPEQVDRLEERSSDLRRRFLALLADNDFAAAISYGTGDPQKVQRRFSRINEIIRETLL
jgi:peroxiredoxin